MSDKLLWPVDPKQGLRGIDGFGSGAFHADRVAGAHAAGGKKNGEEYKHMGLDLAAQPGDRIVAWCDGTLLSPGYAYTGGAGDLRSLHLVGNRAPFERFKFTLLYAKIVPELMGFDAPEVRRGDVIAIVQDVAAFKMIGHTRKMVNHVHFEVRRYNPAAPGASIGTIELIDPLEVLEAA
jgi:murein DD-endopeptidase MepM/ murein hydrolase activator NlpD